MEMFLSELKYRWEDLWTAADIVQHSFIVQKSIPPLNLELCQSYILWDFHTDNNYPSFSHSKEMILTEEKCRKILTKSRSLLYTLHLDLPRGREWSLRNDSKPRNLSDEIAIPHVAKICIDEDFYTHILYRFILYACRSSDNNLKILKWFMKFDVLEKSVFKRLPFSIMNYIFECMHSRLDDSEFVMECFRKLDLIQWLINTDSSKPEKGVLNLIYQFHLNRRNSRDMIWIDEFVDTCLHYNYHYVPVVLKLKHTPELRDDRFLFFLEQFSNSRIPFTSKKIATSMSQQRCFLLLQVLWVHFARSYDYSEEYECLRLIWNSVPDSFLSSSEITAAFEEGTNPADISDIYDFYSEGVGGLPPYVIPRKLKHYSRIVIRRRLSENGHWLPDGIKELGLPAKLQSYLNFEK